MINGLKLNVFERFDLLPTCLDLSSYLFREDLNLFLVEDKDFSQTPQLPVENKHSKIYVNSYLCKNYA